MQPSPPHAVPRAVPHALQHALAACALSLPAWAFAQVGMQQTQAAGINLTLVYPTDAVADAPGSGPFAIAVASNAVPARLNGRLIVMSHGTGGSALSDHDLARTFALAGFVVAQPEHRGDNWRDRADAGPVSFERRPQEVIAAIDALAKHPSFAAQLRLDKVGVHGMSAGGMTALTLAGAQWSMTSLATHCAESGLADANFCFFGLRTAEQRQQRAEGYRSQVSEVAPGARTETLIKLTDPRIAAISAMVPVASLLTAQSLASVALPVAIVRADADTMLLPRFHSDYALKHCSTCKAITTLAGAAHFDTLSPWPVAIATAMASMPGGALGSDFKPEQRQLAFNQLAQFFTQQLLVP
jgi:predicted dienelactone hydrolase